MRNLESKIDRLVASTEKIQADVKETKELLKRHAERQNEFEKRLVLIEKTVGKEQSNDRAKNVILFSVEEKKESTQSLYARVKAIFTETDIQIPEIGIVDLFRIGRREEGKNRPLCIKLTAERYKYLIFEKNAELKELGYRADSDVSKQDREVRNKALKVRYILREQGKAPYMRGIKLFLDKKMLTEQELDYIINEAGKEGELDGARSQASSQVSINTQSQEGKQKQKSHQENKGKTGFESQKKLEKFAFQSTGVTTRSTIKSK